MREISDLVPELARAPSAAPIDQSMLLSQSSAARNALGIARRALCVKAGGFFELQTDQVVPSQLDAYSYNHDSTAAERRRLRPGWAGSWKTELGSSTNTIHSLYHWADYDQRDRACNASDPLDPKWCPELTSSTSVVMLEATDVLKSCGLSGAAGFEPLPQQQADAQVAWELRRYQLVLGYPTVPKFLGLYSEGLKDKLSADDSGASQLVSLLYSDSGSLNVVIELCARLPVSLLRSLLARTQQSDEIT